MATVANSLIVTGSVAWKQTSDVTGFTSAMQGPETKSLQVLPSAATFTQVQLSQFTLAAAATATIDLYSFVNAFGATVTCTKAASLLIKATGNGGQLKIELGASNPFSWFLSGTTPAITLTCGSNGCMFLVHDGATNGGTVSNTAKTIKISNPGSATITVTLVALEGA